MGFTMSAISILFILGCLLIIAEMMIPTSYALVIIASGSLLTASGAWGIEKIWNIVIPNTYLFISAAIINFLVLVVFHQKGFFKKPNKNSKNTVDFGLPVVILSSFDKQNQTVRCSFKGVEWQAVIHDINDEKIEKINQKTYQSATIYDSKGIQLVIDIQ